MDDLLSAFDPLHDSNQKSNGTSINAAPLFPPSSRTASTTSTSGPRAREPSKPSTTQTQPVRLDDAPLDLLSFHDEGHDAPSGPTSTPSVGPSSAAAIVQDKAAARQQHFLRELQGAEQHVDWQSSQQAAPTSAFGSTITAASQAVPLTSPKTQGGNTRPGRSGFSPPRRMSRSGLMRDTDDLLASLRSHPSASTSPHPAPPSRQHSQAAPTNPFGNHAHETSLSHGPLSPSELTNVQSELFHPESPPTGSTLGSMRQSSYFGSLGRSTANRQNSSSHTQNANGQQVPAIPSGSASSSRTAAIQNAFAIPPPPSFSNKENTSLPAVPTSPKPLRNNSSTSANPTGASSSGTSWTTKLKPKAVRKLPSFDFPTSLPSFTDSTSTSKPSRPGNVQSNGSSRRTSPARSLTIDSEPLPSVSLKLPPSLTNRASLVLNEDIADGIRPSLPSRLRLCKSWTLVYSLDFHGTSLGTLFTRVQAGLQRSAGGVVLALSDGDGNVFGGYVNEAFVKKEGYYGNGESFLWKVESFPKSDDFRVGPIVKAYKYTGINDYIALSDGQFLSIGGGEGRFGLWIDGNLEKGYSTSCPAFRNECLTTVTSKTRDGTDEAKFQVIAVECWAVG